MKRKVTLSRLRSEFPEWEWTAHVDGNGPQWMYAGKRIEPTFKGPNDVIIASGRGGWKVFAEHHATVTFDAWKERLVAQ